MIKRFFAKPYRFGLAYALLLTAAFVYVLLDAFVIPKVYSNIADSLPGGGTVLSGEENASSESSSNGELDTDQKYASETLLTDTSYEDENISIQIETVRVYDTTVHIADIKINDIRYLKTALADNQYGRNINDTTSAIASIHNAIFAINGDYYGFRDDGYVLRNGTLYRQSGSGEALVLDASGNLSSVSENTLSADTLKSAWQIWSFGPALIEDEGIAVGPNSEISGRSSNSNPRTAIGQIEPLHYIAVVSEGRTSDNEGLSLYQLAEVFAERGCNIAYNLDGGGSSTMVLNGKIINNPTTNGRRVQEREVSDIVYIGYE
ncbi:MAG: phosphodiester glycosidase family protein [Clostridium sp.]|jgi:exopolysaccharide biosynthesis protein|nr:phosphodiester glycosidase family protein [Clostridium sp.]